MALFETFSKRLKRKLKGATPDVYCYDEIPQPFRIQVIHIWATAIGPYAPDRYSDPKIGDSAWTFMHDTLARELGLFQLAKGNDPFEACQQFLQRAEPLQCLDLIELSFRYIDRVVRKEGQWRWERSGITEPPDEAIAELNARFLEHSLGYQYAGGDIIRVDSAYVHAEIVLPALTLLGHENFRGAEDEFLRAHEHYREGRRKEAVAEAAKAFESTLKTICDRRQWEYPAGATAKPLLDIVIQNGLLPAELGTHFAGLRSALEAGLPTIRNRTSGHGQGAEPVDLPVHLAAFALHLAAANIVFAVESHRAKK